jgi:hypothetical protein
MRRNLNLLTLMLLVSLTMNAAPIDSTQALSIANSFITKAELNNVMRKTPSMKSLKLAYTSTSENSETNCFYIFNRGDNEGFVIVSGDDRAPDVLGYTDKGTFSSTLIPSNMKAWLDSYNKQMDFIITHKEIEKIKTTPNNDEVGPLLGDIAWGQHEPYNAKCPYLNKDKKCATGCVATAMAQVMYYERWPDTADKSYAWDDMLPVVTTTSSPAAIDAVSQLMYDAGKSVNMNYGEYSGAYINDVAPAIVHKFNFDNGVRLMKREYYTDAEWKSTVRNEINNNRPVIYAGIDHCFVCDGYAKDDFFHINWGWNGSFDGYYLLSVLNPSQIEHMGYTVNQTIVVGMQKPQGGSKIDYQVICDNLLETNIKAIRKDSITMGGQSVQYLTHTGSTCVINFVVLDKDSNIVARTSSDSINLYGNMFLGDVYRKLYIPSTLKEGNYSAYLVFSNNKGVVDKPVMVSLDQSKYFNIRLTSDSVFVVDKDKSSLSIVKVYGSPDPLLTNENTTIKVLIKNDGGEAFGRINYTLYETDNNIKNGNVSYSPFVDVVLAGHTTTELSFPTILNVQEGEYKMKMLFCYRYEANYSDLYYDGLVSIKKGDDEPKLSLYKTISFEGGNENVNPDNIILNVPLKNDGGILKAVLYLSAYINGKYIGSESKDITMPARSDSMFTIETVMHGGIVGAQYLAKVYSNYKDGNLTPADYAQIYFTVAPSTKDGIDLISNDNNLNIDRNGNVIYITSPNEIHSIDIYSADGKMIKHYLDTNKIYVDNIHKGIYILVITTEKGVIIKKIFN